MGTKSEQSVNHSLDKQVLSVAALLSETSLSIPHYQRPYKWTQKNLNDLIGDIRRFCEKSAYRLGSVVLHYNRDSESHGDSTTLDIVDGQQRTVTLFLLVKAILVERHDFERDDLKRYLKSLEPLVEHFLLRTKFNSQVSEYNLRQNYFAARRIVARQDFSEAHIDFLLHRCEVILFVLKDISEAFQFFDSQNARGRDLDPHDLLKAYHLREFPSAETDLKAKTVSHWENEESKVLANTFANYLYRIRRWVEGKSAHQFSKLHVNVFKGINLDKIDSYPYADSLRIAHHFVDEYNSQYERKIDQKAMRFPFHLDQMVINGRRFFEMTKHYQGLISRVIDDEYHGKKDKSIWLNGTQLDENASKIIDTLNKYKSRHRVGDRYIRNLFDCGLIFYIDKFGMQNISFAVEKLFVWAYRCRLQMKAVQMATMDNYARKNNIFKFIKNAIHPTDIAEFPLETIREVNGTKLKEIKALFRELKYYE